MQHTITIMDFQTGRAYKAWVSDTWIRRNPNDHAVSIGYIVGEDIRPAQLGALLATKQAREVDYNHANSN